MKLSETQLRYFRAVLDHPSDDFAELARIAGLDPTVDFKNANLRGLDFGRADLAGFDFSHTDLRDTNFANACGLSHVNFTGAKIEGARWPSGYAPRTNPFGFSFDAANQISPHHRSSQLQTPTKQQVAVAIIKEFSLQVTAFETNTRLPTAIYHNNAQLPLARLAAEGTPPDKNCVEKVLTVMRGWRPAMRGLAEVLVTAAAVEALSGLDIVAELQSHMPRVPVRVLSRPQEGEYSATGVLCGNPTADGLLADIGEGSLVLVPLDRGTPGVSQTLSLGSIRLAERAAGDPVQARAIAEGDLATVPWLAKGAGRDLYLVGDVGGAMARIHMSQTGYPLQIVHHYTVSREEARDLTGVIAGAGRRALERLPGVARRHIDDLPYAAVVLRRMLRSTGARRVVFSTSGVSEGWLMQRMPAEFRELDPLLASAHEMAAQSGCDLNFPPALFDWTNPLFPAEVSGARRLREAACWMSDIGSHDHPEFRAEQAFLRVLRQPGIGLDHHTRVFLAMAIAVRYGVETDAPFLRPARLLLDVSNTHRAEVLGTALQLAYTLSAGAPDVLAETSLLLRDSVLVLRLPDASGTFAGELAMTPLHLLADAVGLTAVVEATT
jgi:exopolyphosphatase/guanosine-5'-triphosphate,3'-diphosphate pyrophosphatase